MHDKIVGSISCHVNVQNKAVQQNEPFLYLALAHRLNI
jgi:hypothetical protein